MSKEHGNNDSSGSEKNFDISDDVGTSADQTSKNLNEDEFVDDDDDSVDEPVLEDSPAMVSNRATRTASNLEDWGGSFDVDQLHQLRELYQNRQKQTEEDDEQKLLDALKERNTDELQSLRQATAVLERFESLYVEDQPATSKSSDQVRIRPQRFLAGVGRYPNKLLKRSDREEEDEGISELKDIETSEKELPTDTFRETRGKKHKISREVAKLRFSNPGTAFIDHFNLDDEGGASLDLDYSLRSSRKAKTNASDKLRVTSLTTKSRSDKEFTSPQRPPSFKHVILHNQNGELVVNGCVVSDLCDCLQETCQGCFFNCPDCESTKCGPVCRRQRQQFAFCVAEPRQKTAVPTRYNPFRGSIQKDQRPSPEKNYTLSHK